MAEEKVCPDCEGKTKRRVLHRVKQEWHTVKCHCQFTTQVPLVIQPESHGCGIAAVATVAQKTYKEVRQWIHLDRDFTKEGMYTNEMEELLMVYDFTWQVIWPNATRLGTKRTPWPPAPWADLHVAQVRNLSDSGWHFVVIQNDGLVLDPCWGVIQGLHRYPEVNAVYGLYKLPTKEEEPQPLPKPNRRKKK